jgi:lipopolysaccharide export system permease protein
VIITRYLIKEILKTLGGVLLVLFLIALSAQLVGLFSKVAAGTIHINTVLTLFGLYNLTIITFILPLALYLAILLALGRLYQDSEMAALAASGVGPARVVRAVLLVAVLFTVIQGVFSLFLGPWADEQGDQLRLKAQQLTDIQGVVPGRFQELPQGKGVIYIESINQDLSRINNIFVQHQDESRNSRIVAESGHIEREAKTGDRILILENGHRYEGQPGDEDYTILDFKRHGVRIEEKQAEVVQLRRKAMPTRVLLEPHNYPPEMLARITEFQWRVSSALSCIVLALLAVPLSRSSHRQSRYSRIAIAIVFYLLLNNMLNVGRTWLQEGQVPPWLGLWWVHLVTVIIAIVLILRQTGFRHLFQRAR